MLNASEEERVILCSKVIPIGDWNMDTTGSITVAHGLTLSTIRSISCTIRNDANDTYYSLTHGTISNGEAGDAEITSIDATNVNLKRESEEAYDSNDFNATSYNRGWVVIHFICEGE